MQTPKRRPVKRERIVLNLDRYRKFVELQFGAISERHLAQRWQDLFGAKCDFLLYDLTSTYFEGQAEEIPAARRG